MTGVVCAALIATMIVPAVAQATTATSNVSSDDGSQAAPTIPDLAPRPTLDQKVPPGAATTGPTGPTLKPDSGATNSPAKTSPDPLAAAHTAETADSAKAKASGKPVPIPELTTERSTSVVNPDGTVTAAISLAPQRAWVDGAWAPIDTSLVKTTAGWAPKATPAQITLSPGGTGPLAVVGVQGKKITVTWPLGALPAPQISGANALYPQVLPGVDLRVSAGPEGIREVLVVANAHAAANPALHTLRFGVTGTGLTVKTDSSGALLGVDSKGKTVFGGDAPEMWDSSSLEQNNKTSANAAIDAPGIADRPDLGSKTAVMPIHLTGTTAELSPNQGLLTNPGTHFPVYIDPTIAMPTLYCREMFQGAPTITSDCGDPTTAGNLNIMRAGYDPNAGSVGPVRSLFSFDVYNGLEGSNNPYVNQPGGSVYNDPADQPGNIVSANLTLTVNNAPSCNGNLFDLYRTGPFVNPTWNSDGPTSAGAFGSEAQFLGQRSASTCSQFGKLPSIDDTAQVQSVFQAAAYGTGAGTASLGVRMADETTTTNTYWSFFFTRPGDQASTASLNVTYRPNPYIVEGSLATNPPMTKSTCQDEEINAGQSNFDEAPALSSVGYIGKNFGSQIQLSAQLGDIDSHSVYAQYQFADVTGGSGSNSVLLPSSGWYGDNTGTNGSLSAPGPMPVGTITQKPTPLIDGHEYRFSAYVYDPGNAEYTLSAPACYFIVAFNAPYAPAVTSAPDLSPLGTQPKAGMYATMASSAGIAVQAQTVGVNIDHFEYIFDNDPSLIPATAPGAACASASDGKNGCVAATTSGGALSGNTGTATIPVPAGVTTFGTNTVWIRAVDKAGNVSPVGQYDFYLPGNPTATPALGDITGDGVPDVLAVEPVDLTQPISSTNPEHLVTFPGNSDPNIVGAYNQTVEAAPASAAPDGTSWANTLISHRGALRGVPVDDLFAYSTTGKALYYYLNSDIFGGTAKTDMFATNQKVVVTRPLCTPGPANGYCAAGSYAPDWSKVTQIVAFGNAAGTNPGTFAGRTNLITVEDNGNHGGNVWMFSPGPGLGQLTNPVLLSTGDTSKFNWLNADLIAPGANPGQTLPNLWARDRLTGNLWQLNNALGTNGVEDPTSLGIQSAATQLGGVGAYGIDTYPMLFAGGRPSVAAGGALTQTGYPALWDIQNDGQLKFLPGAAGGPITTAAGSWQTTHTAWANANAITSADGTTITAPAGPLLVGEGYTSGNPQLCVDLQNGTDSPNTPIWTWGCNGQAAQDWIIKGDGTIRLGADTANCLEIASSVPTYPVLTPTGSAAGNWGANAGTMEQTPVQLGTCTDTNGQAAPNQHWILRPSPGALSLGQHGWYDIYNPNSGRCLDNGYDHTTTRQQLWIWDCIDSQAQQFQAPAAAGGWDNASTGVLAAYPTTPPSASTSINGDTYTLTATTIGDHYSLTWYVPYDGDYFIESTVATGPANGTMQASIDGGSALPWSVDTYTSTASTKSGYYGAQHLTAGAHTFTFTVTGKNTASTGFQLALTHMSLGPAHGTGPVSALTTTPNPATGNAPFAVGLDASQTYPGRNPITGYTFDFGDGTTIPTGAATTASHTYTTPGTYTAKVTVTDTAGVTTTATKQIVVQRALYELRNDGSLWTYTGTPMTGWQQIDGNTAISTIASNPTTVYELHNDGSVWVYTGTPMTGWTKLDSNTGIASIATSSDNDLYELHTDGSIWKYTGTPMTGWQQIGNNASTTSIATAGPTLYQLHSDGSTWVYTGTPNSGWTELDNNATTTQITAQGSSLYELHNDGSIWSYTGTPFTGWQEIGSNTATNAITVGGDGTVYQKQSDGSIWSYTGTPITGWQELDANTTITGTPAGDDTSLYETHNDGSIWLYTGTPFTGWQELDNNSTMTAVSAGSTRSAHV